MGVSGAGSKRGGVLDSPRMEILRLRFVGSEQPDLPLDAGMHDLGRLPQGGIGRVEGDHQVLARLCVDGRGVWLNADAGDRRVHVNGRAVRRLAMLRRGDTLHLDGVELRLLADRPVRAPDDPATDVAEGASASPHAVLRGIGGRHHGRCFTLDRARVVGSVAEADVRIDDPAFAERHARIEPVEGRLVLRDLGSADGSVVNGEPVRDAVLEPGDQIVFDAYHRFVVEAPGPGRAGVRRGGDQDEMPMPAFDDVETPPRRAWPLPWLLLAALLIAGLLSLLLLYGAP